MHLVLIFVKVTAGDAQRGKDKMMTTTQSPKGLYILGTGTDVGKTYITALWLKKLHEAGHDVAYYKAAVSGAPSISESDAGYVKQVAGLSQEDESLLSYVLPCCTNTCVHNSGR